MPARSEASFESALQAALALLRELPRARADTDDARRRFEALRAAYPGVRARLLEDRPPGKERVEYDVLLVHPAGGTVAVTFRHDDGVPWAVAHAEHWATSHVVSVDGSEVTTQEALIFLKMAGDQQPDLMERLVAEKLVALAVQADMPVPSEEETRAAAEELRESEGLQSEETFGARLREWGITKQAFHRMVREALRRRAFRELVTGGEIEPYFDAHRDELTRIRCVRATAETTEAAERLARGARRAGLAAAVADLALDRRAGDVKMEIATHIAGDLPASVATATPGEVVGPLGCEGEWMVFEVLDRGPAVLDDETRDAVQESLFRRWIAERRSRAAVVWHWL